MPKIALVNHQDALRAPQEAAFRVDREGKHPLMIERSRILRIPRHKPVNAITMGGIVRDAGLCVADFRKLL